MRNEMNGHTSSESHSNGGENNETESLALVIASLNRTLLENQQLTIQTLQQISSRLERLEQNNNATTASSDHLSVERATVRLDGLEVYAVVSALTMATSIQCFDSHGGLRGWDALLDDGNYLQMATDLLFLCCSALGLVAGMHATLVFSLMTMYGRTAVGIGTDAQFVDFFGATGGVRYRGFQTFRASLYSFLLQVLLMVVDKSPPSLRIVGLSLLSYAVYSVYSDTQGIIEVASRILFSKPATSRQNSNSSPPKKQRIDEVKEDAKDR